MKSRYEYIIINKQDGSVEDILPTRSMARNMKNCLKEDFLVDTKIIQNRYKLESSKEVR